MSNTFILDHLADIVVAHVGNNPVEASELPSLIQSVYASLSSLGQPAQSAEEQRTPAVSIRASVKPHAITCLECGAKLKMLKRHLNTDHGLTPDAYRARWNLPADYPIVAADYAARRAELAVKSGLGRSTRPAKATPSTSE